MIEGDYETITELLSLSEEMEMAACEEVEPSCDEDGDWALGHEMEKRRHTWSYRLPA